VLSIAKVDLYMNSEIEEFGAQRGLDFEFIRWIFRAEVEPLNDNGCDNEHFYAKGKDDPCNH